ncbi:extracellular solute-binding protein [Arthrobacter sp. H5]|uniref:ABC transporter substrate-binding protein n=1 Tax=Arthrobacter sp. H5 TaxID=1267973 RepID=UPI000487E71B|nr:extracellular solute-binding protein [Arthrobacter sp. H5]
MIVGITATALALAACGGTGGEAGGPVDGEGKTLNVLMGVDNQYPEERQQWQTDIAAKFKEQTGADIEWETYASANEELTKIQTSVVSGQGPDVYSLGTTFTPTAYATQAFVPLQEEEWASVGGKDRFVPSSLGISGPDDENQVGIPFVSRPFVLAYNTELLAAAGIEEPATSWDELREQAKQLTGDGVYGLSVAYGDNYDPWKYVWGMSAQAGNPLVEEKTATLDDPSVLEAYQTYFGWLTEDKVVDPAAVGWTNPQALAEFAAGNSAYMLMTTSSSLPTLEDSAVAGKYEYALMPTIPPGATERPADGVEAASILSGDNLVVADYSQQKPLAFEFVKLLTDKDTQIEYYELFGQLPTNAEASAELEAKYPELAPILESASKSVGTPFTGAWSDIQLALTNVVVQSVPGLSEGNVPKNELEARIQDAQNAAQESLDRVKD